MPLRDDAVRSVRRDVEACTPHTRNTLIILDPPKIVGLDCLFAQDRPLWADAIRGIHRVNGVCIPHKRNALKILELPKRFGLDCLCAQDRHLLTDAVCGVRRVVETYIPHTRNTLNFGPRWKLYGELHQMTSRNKLPRFENIPARREFWSKYD